MVLTLVGVDVDAEPLCCVQVLREELELYEVSEASFGAFKHDGHLLTLRSVPRPSVEFWTFTETILFCFISLLNSTLRPFRGTQIVPKRWSWEAKPHRRSFEDWVSQKCPFKVRFKPRHLNESRLILNVFLSREIEKVQLVFIYLFIFKSLLFECSTLSARNGVISTFKTFSNLFYLLISLCAA